jgi:hypothetical protein
MGAPPAPPWAQPPSDYPVQLTIPYPPRSNRGLAVLGIIYLLKVFAALPAFICVYFVGIAAFIVFWIAQWAVLFTGRYPEGMHRFVTGYLRWTTRASAWLFGLTDRYPPFRLSP